MIEVGALRRGEGAALLSMIRALARSHDTEKYLVATPEALEAAIFSERPVIGALVARLGGEPAGCAVWHRSFSTFRGAEVMYLEDLAVLPQFRRKGVARTLLREIARLAIAKGYPSIYWFMMDWNAEARALYEGVGTEIEGATCFCRLQGEALERLAQ